VHTQINILGVNNNNNNNNDCGGGAMLGGAPVPTAWRFLGLRMEERPPVMEVSCEYIE
jgi:hypothetical protein